MLPDKLPLLANAGVRLRAFEERDVPLVQSVADDALIPHITTVPTSGTAQDARRFLSRQHGRLTTGEGYSFAIADASTDDAVGQIGLWLRNIDCGRVSTGYWVAPQYRRRGYTARALQVLTGWALELEEVRRVELYVEPWNEGSWGAAERCGYEREGLLRSWQLVGDQWRDMFIYSKLADHP